jgi:hypothetical protein
MTTARFPLKPANARSDNPLAMIGRTAYYRAMLLDILGSVRETGDPRSLRKFGRWPRLLRDRCIRALRRNDFLLFQKDRRAWQLTPKGMVRLTELEIVGMDIMFVREATDV